MTIASITDRAADLLACVDVAPLPCRSVIHPGPNVPFDSCEQSNDGRDGQLWVAVNGITSDWPTPTGRTATCAQMHTVEWELGIVRCAATLSDDGTPPSPADIDADQAQQIADMVALREAIACCWPTSGKHLILDRWDPIPPLGGCVGGLWTFRTSDMI